MGEKKEVYTQCARNPHHVTEVLGGVGRLVRWWNGGCALGR